MKKKMKNPIRSEKKTKPLYLFLILIKNITKTTLIYRASSSSQSQNYIIESEWSMIEDSTTSLQSLNIFFMVLPIFFFSYL
mgnify:CR=1 FL=1